MICCAKSRQTLFGSAENFGFTLYSSMPLESMVRRTDLSATSVTLLPISFSVALALATTSAVA